MNEINELRELVGPEFQTNITVRATLGGHVLEYELELVAMASTDAARPNGHTEAYAEITRKFGDLYARLMSHERWAARDDPAVRVRFTEAERVQWRMNGTVVKRATYYVEGEGSIILVRTSQEPAHE